MNNTITKLLQQYSIDTTDIEIQLELAKAYFDIQQYASAVSYLNRIAETSEDDDVVYESLLLLAHCFFLQGNRSSHNKVSLYHAVALKPKRPEAYFLLCREFEIEEPFQAYAYANISIEYKDNSKRVTSLPFEYEHYKAVFQKAINAWHSWKIEESKEILYDLHINYEMSEFYNELVVNNLNSCGWPEKNNKIEEPKIVDIEPKKPKWAVTDYPTLEITTVIPTKGCVVDCVFCPQEILKKSYTDEMRFMTMADFKKAIDKVPNNVRIIFSGFIEPFMNKHCSDMMIYAYEKGHPIAAFTTGIGMTLDDVEKIKHIPFDDGPNSGFTLHLPDKEHLAKHPITKRYISVLKAIKKAKFSSFYLMSMGDVHEEVEKLGIWKKEDIHIPVMWSRAGNLKGEAQMKPELRKVMDRVRDASEYNSENYVEGELTCGCVEDLYHNILLPNGDVSLCCMDYGLKHITGNLYEQSFEDSIPDNNQSFSLCNGCENAIPIKDKLANKSLGDKLIDNQAGLNDEISLEKDIIKINETSKWGGDIYEKKTLLPKVNTDNEPTIVVVDNFLENPDEVRELALSMSDEYKKRGSVGIRSKPYPHRDIYRPIFEKLLGIKTDDSEWAGNGGTHGCYQWSPAETGQVVHCDATDWAGIIFLSPDAPPRTGTWLMKHKETGKKMRQEGLEDVFVGNQAQWDTHPFEKIDDIANVYNRLILWNGRHLHTAGSYFGESIDNSRLYQVFFFNEKK